MPLSNRKTPSPKSPDDAPQNGLDSTQRYRQLAELASDAIWEHNPDGSDFSISPSFERILGRPVSSFPTVQNLFPFIHPDDLPQLCRYFSILEHLPQKNEYRVRLRHADGSWVTVESRFTILHDATGVPTRVLGVFNDISAQIERERERRIRLETDYLTGLKTRMAGQACIEPLLREANAEHRHALVLVKLRLKKECQKQDHDFLLQHSGAVLRNVAQKNDCAMRLNDSTLLLLNKGCRAPEAIDDLAQTIHRLITEAKGREAGQALEAVSIGIAMAPYDGLTFQALRLRAERACPHADGVCFHDRTAAERFRLNSTLLSESIRRNRNKAQEIMWKIMDNLDTGLLVTDCKTRKILFANPSLQNLFPGCISGEHCHKALFHSDKPCRSCPRHPNEIETINHNTGKTAFVQILSKIIPWLDGKDVRLSIITDITERALHAKKLELMAYRDQHLDIPNRQSALLMLDRLIEARTPFAVILLDIRDFKLFNERFGHDRGDELLGSITEILCRQVSRESLYRSGGDEFLIPLPGADAQKAIRVAKELLRAFDTPLHVEEFTYRCGFDVGISLFPTHGSNAGALITHAELALIEGKAQNIDCLVFNEALERRLSRKKQLQAYIRSGLENHAFEVYFQPIYNVASGLYDKAEALLRLRDETGAFISPAEFIPVAEATGLIVELGQFVLDTVCLELQNLEAHARPLQIAVNISAIQLIQQAFVPRVLQTLKRHGVNPLQLEFEVTESVLIESFDQVRHTMRALQENGIRFSLDDFGTGYSSLSYLTHLPIRTLKLDRSFISQIESSESSRHICRAIIELARRFDMQIIAEGIENAAQANIITEFGATNIQGFFYARPMPDSELLPWLLREDNKHATAAQNRNNTLV